MFIPLGKRAGKLGCPRAQLVHFLGYHYTTAMHPNFLVAPVHSPGKYGKAIISKDVIFSNSIPYLTTNFGLYPSDEEFDKIPVLPPLVLREVGPFPLGPANEVPQYWVEEPVRHVLAAGIVRSDPLASFSADLMMYSITNIHTGSRQSLLTDLYCPHPAYLQYFTNRVHF